MSADERQDHVTITVCSGTSHGTACTCGDRTGGLSRTGADQARDQHATKHGKGGAR